MGLLITEAQHLEKNNVILVEMSEHLCFWRRVTRTEMCDDRVDVWHVALDTNPHFDPTDFEEELELFDGDEVVRKVS